MSKKNASGNPYEILYDLPTGEYSDAGMGGIRTRTIRAGESLEVECYPIARADHAAVRERKRRQSSAAQIALNMRNATSRVRRLLEANFGPGDLAVHPTFDYGFVDHATTSNAAIRREWEQLGYPEDEDGARRMLKNYLGRIKRRIRRKGGDPRALKYLYVIESTREPRLDDPDALPARYHYHMVISSLGVLTVDDLAELWPYGFSKPQPLDLRHNGLAPLAKYLTKQYKRKRKYCKSRTWEHSRNLREPDVRVSDRKISRRRAALVARDVQANGREIFERLYPGFALEECEVRFSDFMPGASIYARLRKRR